MAIGGVKKEVCKFNATKMPKNNGSIPKCANSGRKIGTKMMMISDHSNGQPRTKIINCARIKKVIGEISKLVTNSLMMCSPPRYEKTDEKVQEPTNNQQTIAVVLAVKYTDSRKRCQVKAR